MKFENSTDRRSHEYSNTSNGAEFTSGEKNGDRSSLLSSAIPKRLRRGHSTLGLRNWTCPRFFPLVNVQSVEAVEAELKRMAVKGN